MRSREDAGRRPFTASRQVDARQRDHLPTRGERSSRIRSSAGSSSTAAVAARNAVTGPPRRPANLLFDALALVAKRQRVGGQRDRAAAQGFGHALPVLGEPLREDARMVRQRRVDARLHRQVIGKFAAGVETGHPAAVERAFPLEHPPFEQARPGVADVVRQALGATGRDRPFLRRRVVRSFGANRAGGVPASSSAPGNRPADGESERRAIRCPLGKSADTPSPPMAVRAMLCLGVSAAPAAGCSARDPIATRVRCRESRCAKGIQPTRGKVEGLVDGVCLGRISVRRKGFSRRSVLPLGTIFSGAGESTRHNASSPLLARLRVVQSGHAAFTAP